MAAPLERLAGPALFVGCWLVVAGCGTTTANDEATPGTKTGAPQSQLMTFHGSEGSSSSMMLFGDDSKPTPLRENHGVFARDQRPAEVRISGEVASERLCSDPSGNGMSKVDLGKTEPDGVRILLENAGKPGLDLVAIPTTTNFVGVALFRDGSASCAEPTIDGLTLSTQEDKHEAIVFGLVGDGVASLDLVIDGEPHPAQLGENGFAERIPDAAGKALDKLVLHHTDGSTTEFPPG